MTTIYLVISGHHYDLSIDHAFSTEEKAQEFINRCTKNDPHYDGDIMEMELDKVEWALPNSGEA